MSLNRRSALKNLGLLSGALALKPGDIFAKAAVKTVPEDFQFSGNWDEIRSLFNLKPDLVNLHSGVSPTLKSVLLKMHELSSAAESYPMDGAGELWNLLEPVKKLAADVGHCRPENLVITSSTTVGANIIINGLTFREGDEILYTHHEYHSLVEALTMKSRRFGLKLTKVTLDMPAAAAGEHVEKIKASVTPRTRLLVISHISCLNGEILPVKEIVREMHAMNVEVLIDGAHAFGHIDVNLPEIDCDYYTTCFHKWLAGPMGGGVLYVRPDKVSGIWPLFGIDLEPDSSDMTKFEHFYGYGVAEKASTVLALNLHFEIGMERKQNRLTYLREYWMKQISNPRISFYTPDERDRAAGMASFHVEGYDAHELVKGIKQKYQLALGSSGSAEHTRVRVTPNVFTTTEELDQMLDILNKL
jgi:selenocysteine lyase/cysteine desulfurase